MTNQNIEKDKIKFENLYKSFFADLPNTSICISDNKIVIQEVSEENSDPASVDLELKNEKYIVYFWDGYSLAEKIYKIISVENLYKKIHNNTRNFSHYHSTEKILGEIKKHFENNI